MSSTPPPRLDALTGARFVAALWVLLMHFAVVGALGPREGGLHGAWLEFWIATGGGAVGFFFVLSGFILAHTYGEPAPGEPASGFRRRFWRARFARIYPAYALALVLTTGSALWLGSQGSSPWNACTVASCGGSWLLSLAMLQAWFPSDAIQQLWNAPGWSLSAELLFYALFPLLVRPVVALARRWGGWLVLALWAVQNAGFVALHLNLDALGAIAPPQGLHWWLERLPLLRLPEFVLGIVAWTLWRERGTLLRGPWAFAALVLVLCALWFLPVPEGPPWLRALASGKAYALAPPLFALLVMHLASARGAAAHGLARLLASRPLVLLGEASYALYLLHWCVLQSLFAVFRAWGGGPPAWAGYAAVVLAIALSVAVHRFFERPWRQRLGSARMSPAAGL